MVDSNKIGDVGQVDLGQVIEVALSERTYPIHIGSGGVQQVPQLLRQCCPRAKHAVVISDGNVSPLAARIGDALRASGVRVSAMVVPSGETSKSVAEVERLWTQMLAEHTDRSSVVIAVGGGVVGDLAGFAAASFARGIPLVQIPTTLLSQVDSSVGGKTGINLPGTKNIVGAFWQPSFVVIDTDSLKTLPRREYLSGLAEVAKYGVIMDPELFEYLERNATAVVNQEVTAVEHVIATSCRCKAAVVAEDERETSGRRAILNYGHTFAHAIESVSGYGTYLHGEAVAMGMHMAALLAADLGRVDQAFVERQANLLAALELPIHYATDQPEALWQAMQHDKKVEQGKLRFVLPTRIGDVELVSGVDQTATVAAVRRAQGR